MTWFPSVDSQLRRIRKAFHGTVMVKLVQQELYVLGDVTNAYMFAGSV
jgi:hypothetical protein